MLLIPIAAFVCIALLVVAASMAMSPRAATNIERRLEEVAPRAIITNDRDFKRSATDALRRLGAIAPKAGKAEMGKLQQRLVTAGFRGKESVVTFFGARLSLAVLGFVLGMTRLVGRPGLALALTVCAVAYVLPGMVLARLAKRRQHRIQLGLPDALDLLVVSVEAGLGLDQALQRVTDELTYAHPDLCNELRLVNIELRAGQGRAEALTNFATRTDLDDVSSLVTLLVQTDKFGTSIAQSLRVHSETMRTKRRQRAEEAAAKIGAKMVFPLVICIFPSIWVVTLGPAVIKFIQILLPMANK